MNLRDHDQPCEDEDTYAYKLDDGYWLCEICPGGVAVTIDYNDAEAEYGRQMTNGQYDWPAVIDAALGINDG